MSKVQARDLEILSYIRSSGWCLSTHIKNRFFNGHMPNCTRRLRVLEEKSLVEALNLNTFQDRFWHDNPTLLKLCNVHPTTKVYRLGNAFKGSIGGRWDQAASDSMVAHQVLLGHVRGFLAGNYGHIRFTTESMLADQSDIDGKNRIPGENHPDLAFELKGLKVCLELERKGRRGLDDLNSAYDDRMSYFSVHYDRVLYVIESERDFKKLVERGGGIRSVGFIRLADLFIVNRVGYEPIELKKFLSDG